MAHSSNDGWLSLLLGRDIVDEPPSSVDEIPAARAGFDLRHLEVDLPDVAHRHEGLVLRTGDGGDLAVEVTVPHGDGPFPVLIYSHGGGWCIGSPRSVRRPTTKIAAAGNLVVNVDYALAPEHPFPRGLEDVLYATRWARTAIHEYGGDPANIFLGGDSAGANLAAATVIALASDSSWLKEDDLTGVDVDPAGVVLFSGVFDFPDALRRPASNSGFVEVCWHQAYLGPHFVSKHRDPLVSPALAADEILADFPPTYLAVGSEDSLLPQTLGFTERLGWLNVPVTLSVVAGLDHTFGYVDHLVDGVDAEYERIFSWMRHVMNRRQHTGTTRG